MKRCTRCGTSISYFSILISLWKGYRDVTCPGCQTEYRHPPINRVLFILTAGLSVGHGLVLRATMVSNFRSSFLAVPLLFVCLLILLSFLLVPLLTLEPRED